MTSTLLALAVATVLGIPVGIATVGRRPIAALAAVSNLAGMAALSVSLLILSLLGIAWNRVGLAAGALLVIAALYAIVVLARSGEGGPETASQPLPPVAWGLVLPLDALLVLLAAGYVVFATIAAPAENDFIAIWGLKAKVFWFGRGIDWQFLQNGNNAFAHPDYPPLLPLCYDAIAVIGNAWDDRWLGLVHAAFGVSAILVVRHVLALETRSRLYAAAAAVALSSAALSPWIGLGEGPLIAFGTTGLLLVRAGVSGRLPGNSLRMSRAGAVFLGLAGLTKNEGLTLVLAAALALVAEKRSWRGALRLWPAALVIAPWPLVRLFLRLPTYLVEGNAIGRMFHHLRDLGVLLRLVASNPPGRPLFWAGLLVALAFSATRLMREERFLTTAVALQLCFLLGAYLFTPYDLAWHFQWSWERLVSQLALPLGFLACVLLAPGILRPREEPL